MTVYRNYDVIAFRHCIQIFTVYRKKPHIHTFVHICRGVGSYRMMEGQVLIRHAAAAAAAVSAVAAAAETSAAADFYSAKTLVGNSHHVLSLIELVVYISTSVH